MEPRGSRRPPPPSTGAPDRPPASPRTARERSARRRAAAPRRAGRPPGWPSDGSSAATPADRHEVEQHPDVVDAVVDDRLEAAGRPARADEHVGVVGAGPRGRPRHARAASPAPPARRRPRSPRGSVSTSSSGSRSSRCSSGRRGRGACSYSSAIAMSTPPRASTGSDSSASSSISSTRSSGWAAASRGSAGITSARVAVWNDASAHQPADLARQRRQPGLERLELPQHAARALGQHAARVGQLEPPPAAAEQLDAGLALQLRELLRDRRRREGERLGGAGDRPLRDELAQHQRGGGARASLKIFSTFPCRNNRLF